MVLKDDDDSNMEPELWISVDILTEKEATMSPAGIGRSDPNQDPYLPNPTGRFQWSLNPFKMAAQLCGPEFKKNLCCIIIVLILLLLIFWLFPVILAIIFSS